jgi:hypothetical protein
MCLDELLEDLGGRCISIISDDLLPPRVSLAGDLVVDEVKQLLFGTYMVVQRSLGNPDSLDEILDAGAQNSLLAYYGRRGSEHVSENLLGMSGAWLRTEIGWKVCRAGHCDLSLVRS